MNHTFDLTISSPEGRVFSGKVLMLTLRGAAGDLAILAGHAPFVTTVVPCDCKVELEDETERIAHIEGGLLSVSTEAVTLLSSSFHWKE